MKNLDRLQLPLPKKPLKVLVRIPGGCPECNPSWGRAAEPKPPVPAPPVNGDKT